MKNKKICMIVGITLILILGSTSLYSKAESNEKIVIENCNEKVESISQAYIILDNISQEQKSNDLENAQKILKKINNNYTLETPEIKYYNNEILDKLETIIKYKNDYLKLDTNTGEIISYVHINDSYEKIQINESNVNKIANEIFEELQLVNTDDYTMVYLDKFDDEIYRVAFSKVYGKNYNPGESIKFSFSPMNKKIVSLSQISEKFDNNEIVLTSEEAINKAKKYLRYDSVDDVDVELKIIKPNAFWKETGLYKDCEPYRNAYVCTIKNDNKLSAYIDCTTGKLIGGNTTLGGNK